MIQKQPDQTLDYGWNTIINRAKNAQQPLKTNIFAVYAQYGPMRTLTH